MAIQKEMLLIERERNSLLASIDESLKIIASKENSSKNMYEQTLKDAQKHEKCAGKSAFIT